MSGGQPRYFATPAAWRRWLEGNHQSADELWVGFHKRSTGTPSISWPEAVDEALCHGWIDGIRKRLDDARYMIRFTPRRAGSTWSAVNMRRFEELSAEGRVQPAGRAAWARRRADRSGTYSYERTSPARLPRAWEAELRADTRAHRFWIEQPPSYRRACTHWISSAKREATRRRRMDILLADCAAGQRIRPLQRP